MALADLTDWMDEFGRPGFVWYAKRLSGNDTLANKSHQAGPYIPKDFLFEMVPSIKRPEVLNPDATFELYVDSHRMCRPSGQSGTIRGFTERPATRHG
ncbi:EcoRII N-terminal effector-binding domain-containing protein [Sinorhizobium meliloti]|uniref:EcoRII N-terminal effector-binding domain-containing protein n=1 Tax=Rhizobium meliloti TaxID=382 RepID=UPI002278AF34|nr:EcoRII N-terminal effector-binding domain-containing protein [Sinorhizobium meliloti]